MQSAGQTSFVSQIPLQAQSSEQFATVSPGSQIPFPQLFSLQSCGQEAALSLASQTPLPQVVRGQSCGQERRVSPAPQIPSPQVEVVAQSAGQLAAVSPLLQLPSPQPLAQSVGHVWRVSVGLQIESPQKQSCGQVTGFSVFSSQSASPHFDAAWISFSPIGARPHAAPTPMPVPSSPTQQARRKRPHDLVARTRDIFGALKHADRRRAKALVQGD